MISLNKDTTTDFPGNKWLQVQPFFIFFVVLFLFTCRLPFFWDKDILFSKTAIWLLENDFNPLIPNDIDAGYPLTLAYLLALAWKITGINLLTAHFLMLPFTLGIVWQTSKLLDHFLGGKYVSLAMIIMLADTTFLSQTVVFSTDLVMLFFMLLALNSIISDKRGLLAFAIAGLLFSHMRGLMVAVTLGVFDLYRSRTMIAGNSIFGTGSRKTLTVLFRIALPYIPALIIFAAWMLFHYEKTGWILYHPASPWAVCFETANTAGIARNVLILFWRMADYGKLFVWIIPVLAILLYDWRKLIKDDVIRTLLFLLAITFLLSAPTMLIYKILNGHRYLIPFYYLLSLLAVYLLFINPGFKRIRKILFSIVLIGLISGSFWVYPGKIANGWDATMAHLPYHHLRKEMIRYIDEKKIPFDKVGSEVPNIVAVKYIELNKDERSFHRADLRADQYVFYSNVFNMFTDEEIDELTSNWVIEKEYRCLQVYVRLYNKSKE